MKKYLYTLLLAWTGFNAFATIDASDSLIFDLSKATMSAGTVSFPVSISSDDTIHSLDFSFKYDQTHLTYDSIQNVTAYIQPLAYYSAVDSTVRFTSFSMQPYAIGVTMVKVHFTLLAWQIDSADFNSIAGYLNGNICSVKLINSFPSGLHEMNGSSLVKVFPNPASEHVTIEVQERASVQILDLTGRSVYFEKAIAPNRSRNLPLTGLTSGMYLVRVFNERFSIIEKIVLDK